MTSSEQPTEQGRLAEELRLLLDALAERAEPWLHRVAATEGEDGAPHTPATCGWCPLCATIALLRGERPEAAVRLAEQASGLLAALRAALDERAPGQAAEHPEPGPEEPPPSRPSRVQHIPVRRRGGTG